jgi:FtsP/CotA-like multicopper oxidase with cupredoxin domain
MDMAACLRVLTQAPYTYATAEPAAWHELHAVKDVTLVNPSPVYAAPGLVPPSNPTDIYPPGSQTTYEQFVAENARPFAPFTESFRPKCAPLTRALFAFEDYPGRFVWHCHLLEHEDNDMMRPLRICAPPGFKALGVADDACLRPKCISPATAVAYDVRNGFSAI